MGQGSPLCSVSCEGRAEEERFALRQRNTPTPGQDSQSSQLCGGGGGHECCVGTAGSHTERPEEQLCRAGAAGSRGRRALRVQFSQESLRRYVGDSWKYCSWGHGSAPGDSPTPSGAAAPREPGTRYGAAAASGTPRAAPMRDGGGTGPGNAPSRGAGADGRPLGHSPLRADAAQCLSRRYSPSVPSTKDGAARASPSRPCTNKAVDSKEPSEPFLWGGEQRRTLRADAGTARPCSKARGAPRSAPLRSAQGGLHRAGGRGAGSSGPAGGGAAPEHAVRFECSWRRRG